MIYKENKILGKKNKIHGMVKKISTTTIFRLPATLQQFEAFLGGR